MASGKQDKSRNPSTPHRQALGDSSQPEWADGLRQLYDSVVDEPLPDSFKDLLDKLDESEPGSSAKDGGS